MTLTRFQPGDIVIKTEKTTISTWTDNQNNLQNQFTSSNQAIFNTPTSSGNYYVDVYNKDPQTDTTAEVQFSCAYGHRNGSGSLDFTADTGSFGLSTSRATYSQYRQLVYGEETQNFQFGTHTPDDIYVINIERKNYKQNLKPGSLSLFVSSSGDSVGGVKLTDDSVTNPNATLTNAGRQFNLVSGSLGILSGSTIQQKGGSASYGYVYPDAGYIILNPDAFNSSSMANDTYPAGAPGEAAYGNIFPHRANNDYGNNLPNNQRLQLAISGGAHFIVDSEEKITSRYYFVRARNSEYNHSNNPTFTDSEGNLMFDSMIDSPRTFITTVGLYNDSNDLVAVAKVSQPIAKDFSKEALIRVKLDY